MWGKDPHEGVGNAALPPCVARRSQVTDVAGPTAVPCEKEVRADQHQGHLELHPHRPDRVRPVLGVDSHDGTEYLGPGYGRHGGAVAPVPTSSARPRPPGPPRVICDALVGLCWSRPISLSTGGSPDSLEKHALCYSQCYSPQAFSVTAKPRRP